MSDYFKYSALLQLPIKRAAYSDRTAWLMAEMSRLAYVDFEHDDTLLKEALADAQFELVQTFDAGGTQAFLARRKSDAMAVLSFRGTQVKDPRDILADLDARFFKDQGGANVHTGFQQAFDHIKKELLNAVKSLSDDALYVTGHSLGGALALIATKVINTDNLAACYTYGSPRVGNEEFADDIKPPIYRVVNAHDPVPAVPPIYLFRLMSMLPWKWAQSFATKFQGYEHHGDMRYLSKCQKDLSDLKVIANYNDLFRLGGFWQDKNKLIGDHSIEVYCQKLAHWALTRNG